MADSPITIRPLQPDDIPAVDEVAYAAFSVGYPEVVGRTPEDIDFGRKRCAHCLESDPGGAWVAATPDGTVVGCSLAIVRGSMWGLSLLVVDPGTQSRGLGAQLLDAAIRYGDEHPSVRGGIVLSSNDPRALRRYGRAGFRLEPTFDLAGKISADTLPPSPRVREGELTSDQALADAVDRELRGSPHGEDLAFSMRRPEAAMYVIDGLRYAIRNRDRVILCAARTDDAAAELLVAALRGVGDGVEPKAGFITARQQWASDVALQGGLALKSDGALCTRGELGSMAPYLPSGAWL